MPHPFPAVFVVREGILDELAPDTGALLANPGHPPALQAVRSPERFVLCRNASGFVRGLQEEGFLVVVLAVHPGLKPGDLSPLQLDRIHRRLREELADGGVRVTGIHSLALPAVDPTGTVRLEDLLVDACSTHRIEPHRSFLVCRSPEEVSGARNLGMTTVQIGSRDGVGASVRPDACAADLTEALQRIRSLASARTR